MAYICKYIIANIKKENDVVSDAYIVKKRALFLAGL